MSTYDRPALITSFFCLLRIPLLAALLMLGACVVHGPAASAGPEPEEVEPPSTQVYFYPKAGQSQEQQDRDRYECYLWAVDQTGFDPSNPKLAPHQRVNVVPRPPAGRATAAGAVSGAVIGAAVSRPGNKAGGAVIGAIAGATLGAMSDAAREERARQIQEHYDQADAERDALVERQAQDYRRAMAACLEGRGYSVSE